MRPIDADVVLRELKFRYPSMPLFKELRDKWAVRTEGYIEAGEIIMNAPTIDAVRVVRCRDCKYMSKGEEYLWCDHERGMDLVDADDFCSHGEREGE